MKNYWKKSLWSVIFIGLAYLIITFFWLGPETTRRATDFFFTIVVVDLITLTITFVIYKTDSAFVYARLPKLLTTCGVSMALSIRYLWTMTRLLALNSDFLPMNILVIICLILGTWLAIVILRKIIKKEGWPDHVWPGSKSNPKSGRIVKKISPARIETTFVFCFMLTVIAFWWLPNIFFPGF